MDDGVTRIYVKSAQSVEMTTESFEAGTSQNAPQPYDQQFGTVQAAPVGPLYDQQFGIVEEAPVGYLYNQQLGTVQIAAVCPPYSCDQQFGAVPAAPEGGYFNPSPVPDVTNNTYCQQETHIVAAEPPERDCCFYCFYCSKGDKWYEPCGKGFVWIFLLLLLWIPVGALMVAFFVIALAIWVILALNGVIIDVRKCGVFDTCT
ncbi:uncharacterized protein LOC141883993 isoform X1 [Acropora palmata]|uniref:uncharacterized protein LOC141883993 isoform X1 n=1 Tax=Acropora palmata TaxID=6131 RepID=UPI003DA09998